MNLGKNDTSTPEADSEEVLLNRQPGQPITSESHKYKGKRFQLITCGRDSP
jgi:hypothetical protein